MKFTVGKLGIELLFSWNPDSSTPPLSIPPRPSINPPVATSAPDQIQAAKNIREVVYTITSAFEGGPIGKINYSNLSGNGDGQGMSIGWAQFCTGQNSDRQLFKKLEADYPGVLRSAFGAALYTEFMGYLDKPTSVRLAWVQRAVNDSQNRIEPNWKKALLSLCATKEFQSVQDFFCEKIFQRAVILCHEYGLKTNRALALCFDICVQNGSISSITRTSILAARSAKEKVLGHALTEKQFLELIAIERANAANPRWRSDVLSRKMCLATGFGVVHGDRYDLSKLGLNDQIFTV